MCFTLKYKCLDIITRYLKKPCNKKDSKRNPSKGKRNFIENKYNVSKRKNKIVIIILTKIRNEQEAMKKKHLYNSEKYTSK